MYPQSCIVFVEVFNMAAIAKNNRINIRVSDDDKKILELAAQINNVSVSSYIIDLARKQAELDVKNNETIILGNKERDIVLSLLDKPTLPNAALKELMNSEF